MIVLVGLLLLAATASAIARRDRLDGRMALRFGLACAMAALPAVIVVFLDPGLMSRLDDVGGFMLVTCAVVLGGWSAPHLAVALIATASRPPGERWNGGGRPLVNHAAPDGPADRG